MPISDGPPNADASGIWLPPKAPLPTPRWLLGLGVLDDQLHALGGTDPGKRVSLATHEVYDPVTNQWSTRAPMPTARSMLAVATVGGRLYAIGGYELDGNGRRSPLATTEVYDPATDRWSARAAMPTPRGRLAVGVVGGKIYAVGGEQSTHHTVAVNEVYDPATDLWSACAGLNAGRSGIAAAVVDETLFLCGGAGNDEVVLNTVEAYDAARNSYATRAPMPTARWLAGAAVAEGRVYVVGGSAFATDQPLAANEDYDPRANTWRSEAPIPRSSPISWSAAAAAITQLLVSHMYVLLYNGTQTQTLAYLASPFGDASG